MAEKILSEEELATYPPFPDWSPVAIRKLLHSHELLRSQLATLEAERDGLKRDAERWKWVESDPNHSLPYLHAWYRSGLDPDLDIAGFVDRQLQEPTT